MKLNVVRWVNTTPLGLAVVPLVFCNITGFGWRELMVTPTRYWAAVVVLLVGIMPAFSPGIWDKYLSFHLYSGQGQRVVLIVTEPSVEALPEFVPQSRPATRDWTHVWPAKAP